MSRPSKSAGTRERMLTVAERLFAAKGYEGTHLEEIANEVGVRKTALYYYFDSKEALYVTVLESMLEPMADAVIEMLEADPPVRERAERLLAYAHELLAARPTYAQIVIRVLIDRVPFDSSRVAPILQRLLTAALAFYEEGVREGVFRKLSALHTFQSAMGMMILHYAGGETAAGLLDRQDLYDEDEVAQRLEQYRELLFHGVIVEPKRAPDV